MSDPEKSFVGKFIVPPSFLFLNVTLSIVVGVTLNIVSLTKHKTYIRNRRNKDETSMSNVAHSSNTVAPKKKLTQKEITENKAEKNMLYMALTLGTILILSRILVVIIGAYFFF